MIENTDWSTVYSENDPNISYDTFIQIIKSCYDAAFPLQQIKTYKKARKPWVTREMYKRMQKRDKLFDTFIRYRDLAILNEYKKIRNKLTSDLKKLETGITNICFLRYQTIQRNYGMQFAG